MLLVRVLIQSHLLIKQKKAIRKAFTASMQGKGSSLIEIVATCNSGWKLSPVKANEWMREICSHIIKREILKMKRECKLI